MKLLKKTIHGGKVKTSNVGEVLKLEYLGRGWNGEKTIERIEGIATLNEGFGSKLTTCHLEFEGSQYRILQAFPVEEGSRFYIGAMTL